MDHGHNVVGVLVDPRSISSFLFLGQSLAVVDRFDLDLVDFLLQVVVVDLLLQLVGVVLRVLVRPCRSPRWPAGTAGSITSIRL